VCQLHNSIFDWNVWRSLVLDGLLHPHSSIPYVQMGRSIALYTGVSKMNYFSFVPLAHAECDNSLPFSGASSIPLCYVLFPATLLHQLFFRHLSPHLAICFLIYFSILFSNSYIPFGDSVFFHSLYMPKPTLSI